MKTDISIAWVEVTRYCYPWHGEYQLCKIKVESAVLIWKLRMGKDARIFFRYPEAAYKKDNDKFSFLPTHVGFETEEDAVAFKLLCSI